MHGWPGGMGVWESEYITRLHQAQWISPNMSLFLSEIPYFTPNCARAIEKTGNF